MDILDKILRTPDLIDIKTQSLFESLRNIKKQGFITKEQGIKILKWKSPRPLKRYESNLEISFKEISQTAFNSKNERIKIHILTALNGVKYPAASAILMFYDKTKYPVIDIRVWKQLYKSGLVKTNPSGQGFNLNEWEKYLEIIRMIANKAKLTPRQVEKRLYDIDKKEQIGTLYKGKNV
jgi:transcriptional antiterminator